MEIIQGLLFREVSPQGQLASMLEHRGWKGETLETPARICRLKLETSEVDTYILDTLDTYTGNTSSYLQVKDGNK